MVLPRVDEPLLTAAEELELGLAIEAGLLAGEAGRIGRSVAAGTQVELAELEAIGEQARRRFLLGNVRLVTLVARREAGRSGTSEADLFQEGFLGLLQAVQRFDVRRGCRFSTYAMLWIRAYVTAAAATRCGELNVPVGRAERLRKLRGVEGRLVQERGRTVSSGELAEASGQPSATVSALFAHRPAASLDEEAAQQIPDPHGEVAEEVLRRGNPAGDLLRHLRPLERRVVRLRYGFGPSGAHTVADTARLLQLAPAAVGRLERTALERLRGHCPQSAVEYLAG